MRQKGEKNVEKSESYYYRNFIECVELGCKAAVMLDQSLNEFHPETLSQKLDEMHEIEHGRYETRDERCFGKRIYCSYRKRRYFVIKSMYRRSYRQD